MTDPAAFGTFNLGEIMERGQRFRDQRKQEQDRKRLGDLIPQALGRGGIGEAGAVSREQAITEIFGIDHNLAMKLDDRQRAQAKAELDDLSAAVRWADTPEKWGQVQQHFGQKGVDLSPYGYEDRERGLLALGQLGSYLESLPKPEQATALERDYKFLEGIEPGLGQRMARNKAEGSPIVANNGDGTFTIIPRSYGGGGNQPQPPAPPPPGFVIDGGPTRSASGGFPASGN